MQLRRSVTGPTDAAEALRELGRRAFQELGVVPARALTLVVAAPAERVGEVLARLRETGRNHPSRVVLLAVVDGEEGADGELGAFAEVAGAPGDETGRGMLRERVLLPVAAAARERIGSLVAPLLVEDVPTVAWAPDLDDAWLDPLRGLCGAILFDARDRERPAAALERAQRLAMAAHVVDLEWLRSEPWRLRVAELFDPPQLRRELWRFTSVEVRHAPESRAAALLFCGWLASRLGWEVAARTSGGEAARGDNGGAKRRRPRVVGSDLAVTLRPDREMPVPGLAGVSIATEGGVAMRLDRGPGGLVLERTLPGPKRLRSVVLGASRGERGILAEALRQALLRDPSYRPALGEALRLEGAVSDGESLPGGAG